jgi:GxxExxY protein
MSNFSPIPDDIEELAKQVIDAAYSIHTTIGPGCLEKTYQSCMKYELKEMGIDVISEFPLPLIYKGIVVKEAYKIDLLVGKELIVEIKSVESILPVHKKQLITYLRLSKKRLGLIINFNTEKIKDGIKRIVL